MFRVAPAAHVPPRGVVDISGPEENQETFLAAEFSRLVIFERHGIERKAIRLHSLKSTAIDEPVPTRQLKGVNITA